VLLLFCMSLQIDKSFSTIAVTMGPAVHAVCKSLFCDDAYSCVGSYAARSHAAELAAAVPGGSYAKQAQRRSLLEELNYYEATVG
jgi:hypothetical protein